MNANKQNHTASLLNYLEKNNLTLPNPSAALGSYAPAVTADRLVFISGQLPIIENAEGKSLICGTAGETHTLEQASQAARQAGLMIIAQLQNHLGNLDLVQSIVRLEGFVACTSSFTQHPAVINGASNLILDVFGQDSIHSRTAIGVTSLPNGAIVEISAIAAL